jgi:hypothetical protein
LVKIEKVLVGRAQVGEVLELLVQILSLALFFIFGFSDLLDQLVLTPGHDATVRN